MPLKVSVIIPVYNAEKYLRECLESLLTQDADFEAIIIDDGSEDSSPSICEEYATKTSRFIYKRISNSGPATARNIGLKLATGQWVTFLDSDDLLEPGYLNICDSISYKYADVIFAMHKNLSKGALCEVNWKNEGEEITDLEQLRLLKEQSLDIYARQPFQKISPTWGKFYRREILSENNIEFPTGLYYYEDAIFLRYFLDHTRKACFVHKDTPRYIYRDAEQSLTHQHNTKVIERRLKTDFFWGEGFGPESQQYLDNFFLDQFYFILDTISRYATTRRECIKLISSMYEIPAFRGILHYSLPQAKKVFKHQWGPYLIFKSRYCYLQAMNLYNKNKRRVNE